MSWAAGIGAATNFIGGLFDRSSRKKELAFQRHMFDTNVKLQDPVYRRGRLEKAGLNPAAHFGATGGNAHTIAATTGPIMGRAIADAGALLASGFDTAQQHKLEVSRLEMEKQRLDHALKREVIRPNVGGVYQQRAQNAQERAISDGSSRRLSGGHAPPVREAVHKYIDVWDSDVGGWISILNPELTESGPQEMATGVTTLAGAAAVQHGIPNIAREQTSNNERAVTVIRRNDKPFERPKKRFDDDLEKYKAELNAREYRRVTKPRRRYFGPSMAQ